MTLHANLHAIKSIYRFEMARWFRTLAQSVISPVLSTSLYFVVFGSAIGSRMQSIDGVSYGAYIVPGLIMLSLLGESISNASFGIYMPKWAGTIYELLSAPVSYIEVVIGYVGAAATKSLILGVLILATARLFVPDEIAHPLWMVCFLLLTAVTFSLIGFVIGIVGSILGYPQATRLLVIQFIAAPAGLAWGLFVVGMALNKPYRDFRIALLPRDANHAEVFS